MSSFSFSCDDARDDSSVLGGGVGGAADRLNDSLYEARSELDRAMDRLENVQERTGDSGRGGDRVLVCPVCFSQVLRSDLYHADFVECGGAGRSYRVTRFGEPDFVEPCPAVLGPADNCISKVFVLDKGLRKVVGSKSL